MALPYFSLEAELLPLEGGGYRKRRDGGPPWVTKLKANFAGNPVCKNRRVSLTTNVLHIRSFKPDPHLGQLARTVWEAKSWESDLMGYRNLLAGKPTWTMGFKKYLWGGVEKERCLPPNANGRVPNPLVSHLAGGEEGRGHRGFPQRSVTTAWRRHPAGSLRLPGALSCATLRDEPETCRNLEKGGRGKA